MLRFMVVARCKCNGVLVNQLDDGTTDIIFLIPEAFNLINLDFVEEEVLVAHVAE